MACFTPILGKRIRVTRLDACGNVPAPGTAASVVTTDGFVSIKLKPEIEDGNEITKRKANGSMCLSVKTPDSFKRFAVELEFCGVNPDLYSLMTNAESYGAGQGMTIGEGALTKAFALELWTGLDSAACEEGAQEASGYFVLPFVQAGVLGDLEVNGEDSADFKMTGASTKGGNLWGVGPYDVLLAGTPLAPAPLQTPLASTTHFLLLMTGLMPPPSSCAIAAMPSTP